MGFFSASICTVRDRTLTAERSLNLTSSIERTCQNRQALLYMPIWRANSSDGCWKRETKNDLLIIANSDGEFKCSAKAPRSVRVAETDTPLEEVRRRESRCYGFHLNTRELHFPIVTIWMKNKSYLLVPFNNCPRLLMQFHSRTQVGSHSKWLRSIVWRYLT